MENKHSKRKKRLGRDVFLSGEYIRYFNPEDKKNPFFRIYRRKRQDTLDIINLTEKAKNILDVGGGRGRLTLDLAELEGHDVVLMDISIDMLKLAQNRTGKSQKIKLVNADAHHLPFKPGSFDCVVGLDLFCHLENPARALQEFYRVLSKRGILILDSTNSNALWALFYPRYLGKNPLNWFKIIKFRGVYPGWESIVKHYPKKTFLSLLQTSGFRILRQLSYGPKVCPKWHLALTEKTK